jgi:hypothetical protein
MKYINHYKARKESNACPILTSEKLDLQCDKYDHISHKISGNYLHPFVLWLMELHTRSGNADIPSRQLIPVYL